MSSELASKLAFKVTPVMRGLAIHVAVASDTERSAARRAEIIEMHARSHTRLHRLTDDPEEADIILLAGDLESLEEAKANRLIRKFPEKTMAYSEIDAVVPYVPGVYGSAAVERWIKLGRTQSSIYFSRYAGSMNPEIRHRPTEKKELLFCFRGRRDCRVRTNIINYPYNRADVEVLETKGFMHWKDGIVGTRQAQKSYADALARSHFALCPRGMGFGSIRLFEVMEMGVAPVLISDNYALPPGPDWDSFLLKVPERQFSRLPDLIEHHVPESEERGRKARQAWEQFFAPGLIFNGLIDQLCDIRQRRVISESAFRRIWPLLRLRSQGRIWASATIQRGLGVAKRAIGKKSREHTPQT
jgi:Exostosin family